MLPINQVILGGTDPLLNTGSLTDQIHYLEEQKRLIEARQKQIQQAANGQQTLINNIDSFDKFINTIAKDGKIDIEGIVDEEIEIIKSIPNFDFNIPVLGNGNISNGNITLSIPFINKGIMFNQSDLETFRQLLTK